MHSGQLETGSASIYYEVAGAGTPVVLIHGFAIDLRMWDAQVAALAPRYQVVRYDLRGFGRSTAGTDAYSHAGDLHALLTHLHIDRAALVGLSMGGGAAINYAIQYPDAVSALVAVDPSLGGFPWSSDMTDRQREVRTLASTRGVAAALDAWLAMPFLSPALSNPESGPRVRQLIGEYSGYHWLHDDMGIPMKPPAIQRLQQIRAPTLVIVGERDTSDFHKIADILARRIRNARKRVMAGVGHMANLEDPRTFDSLILDYLAATRAGME